MAENRKGCRDITALQNLTADAYIIRVRVRPDYGDKRLRNKRLGPGGSTRRLHHKPIFLFGGMGFCGGETGSTNV